MTKIQAYFPDDLILELRLKAKQEGKNFSEILREAVIFLLSGKTSIAAQSTSMHKDNQKLAQLRKYVGIINTDGFESHQNASEEIDKIVYGL